MSVCYFLLEGQEQQHVARLKLHAARSCLQLQGGAAVQHGAQ